MSNPDEAAMLLKQIDRKTLDGAYEALRPIAERSTMMDCQRLAKIGMKIIEELRGDEKKTELPSRHHG